LNTKMIALILGVVLIVVALILGGVQIFYVYNINIYGASANRLYFYGALAIIGIIGIILTAWGIMKRGTLAQTTP
jgi:hypothetical protein